MTATKPQRTCECATAIHVPPKEYTNTAQSQEQIDIQIPALHEKQIEALKARIHQLNIDNAALYLGYESLLGEFIELHLDMSPAWSRYVFENFHRHRLPEPVMLDLRANLEYLRVVS